MAQEYERPRRHHPGTTIRQYDEAVKDDRASAAPICAKRQTMNYDDFQRDLRRRKRERWAKILASEPPGRVAGRRPRDPVKEDILLRLDRARLARESR